MKLGAFVYALTSTDVGCGVGLAQCVGLGKVQGKGDVVVLNMAMGGVREFPVSEVFENEEDALNELEFRALQLGPLSEKAKPSVDWGLLAAFFAERYISCLNNIVVSGVRYNSADLQIALDECLRAMRGGPINKNPDFDLGAYWGNLVNRFEVVAQTVATPLTNQPIAGPVETPPIQQINDSFKTDPVVKRKYTKRKKDQQ